MAKILGKEDNEMRSDMSSRHLQRKKHVAISTKDGEDRLSLRHSVRSNLLPDEHESATREASIMNQRPSRLLVVDCDEMNREMLASQLRSQGYQVDVAESAKGLLERVKTEEIDLLLLDAAMPENSSHTALSLLRETYSAVELPIIMITAKDQSEEIVEALKLGANDIITKPVNFMVALARIGAQLSHKRAEEALRESEQLYSLAARGANDGLWDWNLSTNVMGFSPRWKNMLGYQEHEIGDKPEEWFDRIHTADRARVLQQVAAHHKGLTPHFESEYRMLHKDGTFRWMLSRGLAVPDASGKGLRMAGSQTDITAGKLADVLTGFPNRLLLLDRLGRLIENAKRHNDYSFAVLSLDLDGFKIVNDSLGHTVGDQLLIEVANRLDSCLRHPEAIPVLNESYTIARLGGDEFTVLLDHLERPADATLIAERLLKELSSPFHVGGKEVFVSVSTGIALSSPRYDVPEDMLRDADTAMSRAKSRGKACFEVFDSKMRARVMARLQIETDLRRALERQEFQNFYQPIVCLSSGSIAGFEALLRWNHPTRGLLQPSEFIPIAEETGLIRELGWWNLREACRQASIWNKRHNAKPALMMSVNLSAKQFLQPNLVAHIGALLKEVGLAPQLLKLEITESTVMADPRAAVEMLLQIRALGIWLAIDDFGTGYSSLSYLHSFPLDTLKIDRSFTMAMRQEGDSMTIVRTIMPMANNLGLDVVAEGVETVEHLELLK